MNQKLYTLQKKQLKLQFSLKKRFERVRSKNGRFEKFKIKNSNLNVEVEQKIFQF